MLKVVSATFLLVCFLSLKESFCETRKKKLVQKLFSFSRKLKFRILDTSISWHQMPKHKTRNGFYWIAWESKYSLLIKFGQFMWYYKRKSFLKKFYKNCNLETISRPSCVCKKIKHNLCCKMRFLKQRTYIRYVIVNYQICQNQHAHLLGFLFTDDFFKN